MKRITIGFINLYQRFVSPRKGFRCAYGSLHGSESCSQAIKRIVADNGLLRGWGDIRNRFLACRSAAQTLKASPGLVPTQAFDCSCDPPGLDGCSVPDFDSCFGGGDTDCSSSKGSSIVIYVSLSFALILLLFFGWQWARAIDSVEIQLINPENESGGGVLASLVDGESPDYQAILTVSGETIESEVLRNRSAVDWLSLNFAQSPSDTDVDELKIIDKELLKDHVLEVIREPGREGEGEHFRYRIQRRWF